MYNRGMWKQSIFREMGAVMWLKHEFMIRLKYRIWVLLLKTSYHEFFLKNIFPPGSLLISVGHIELAKYIYIY